MSVTVHLNHDSIAGSGAPVTDVDLAPEWADPHHSLRKDDLRFGLRDRPADHRGRHDRGQRGTRRPTATPNKRTTTVAMDFGRVSLDSDLILYLFGTRTRSTPARCASGWPIRCRRSGPGSSAPRSTRRPARPGSGSGSPRTRHSRRPPTGPTSRIRPLIRHRAAGCPVRPRPDKLREPGSRAAQANQSRANSQ
jgi:hypothetical protein